MIVKAPRQIEPCLHSSRGIMDVFPDNNIVMLQRCIEKLLNALPTQWFVSPLSTKLYNRLRFSLNKKNAPDVQFVWIDVHDLTHCFTHSSFQENKNTAKVRISKNTESTDWKYNASSIASSPGKTQIINL